MSGIRNIFKGTVAPKPHKAEDHVVDGPAEEDKAKQVIARHLCGWLVGHRGPVDHFLVDAEMIVEEMREEGVFR